VQFLKFLDTNQAWGATAVDIGCMVLPRTAVDFTRGPDAGFETMRRESSGTANHALVGAYGLTAAWALSRVINRNFEVKAHKMFVSNDRIDYANKLWSGYSHIKDPEERSRAVLGRIFDDLRGFNPDAAGHDDNGFVKFSEEVDKETKNKFIDRSLKEIKEQRSKGSKAYLSRLIGESLGAESQFKLGDEIDEASKKSTASISSLDTLLDDVHSLLKSFTSKKVEEAFKENKLSVFVNKLKKLNKGTSILGLGIAVLVGVCVQPFNMYLTKKKTGKSGFVGVENKEPDKSKGFLALKLATAGAFGLAVLRSIGKPSEILSRIQFKGFTPTINQFKLVYGMTIMSRFLAARDKNELRESSIKDTLGFANWLILGGFVSKLAASGVEKMAKFKGEKFIRYNKVENGSGGFNWITKLRIITRDEVLYEAFKKAGKSTIKVDKNGNEVAMTFKEMMRELDKFAPELRAITKSKIKYLNMIQLVGYLYSGLVLGLGIPKLNIAITKAVEKKKKNNSPAPSPASAPAPSSADSVAPAALKVGQ